MPNDNQEYLFGFVNNEFSNDLLVEQGLARLLKDVTNSTDYFSFNTLAKYQEPAQYPRFNFEFLKASLLNEGASPTSTNLQKLQTPLINGRSPMVTIRVDPSILQNSSQKIESSSATLSSVNSNLNSYSNSAPSYDGQFGSQVRAIIAGATSQGSQLSNTFSSLANRLRIKAQQFVNADNTSATSLGGQYNNLSWMPIIVGSSIGQDSTPFPSLWKRLFPNWTNLMNPVFGNLVELDVQTSSGTSSPNSAFNPAYVPAGIGQDGSYRRNSYSNSAGKSYVSNCTWYVAAAVAFYSGNNVDLLHEPSLGNASMWVTNINKGLDPNNTDKNFAWIKRYFSSPDHGFDSNNNATIKVGDIYQKGYHVAFIQGVTSNSDGSVQITVSEENAGTPIDPLDQNKDPIGKGQGDPISKDSNLVMVNGDTSPHQVYRYTRVITIAKGDTSVNIIHVNYGIKND